MALTVLDGGARFDDGLRPAEALWIVGLRFAISGLRLVAVINYTLSDGLNAIFVWGTRRRPTLTCPLRSRGQLEALPDRHGSLRRRTSPEPQTRVAWSRCQVCDRPNMSAPPIARDRRTT